MAQAGQESVQAQAGAPGSGHPGFRGAPVVKLDAKGRLTVPARHKDALLAASGGELVVTKSAETCVTVWPRAVWEAFEAKLALLPMSADWLRRRFLGHAQEVTIDAAGRLQLPPELRQWAHLEGDVVFMGMGNRLELWDRARYDAKEDAEMSAEAMRGMLDGLFA